jgi:Zinc knuckle
MAGQYNNNLTLVMLKHALLPRGDGNEDFRFSLCTIKTTLEHALVQLGFLKPNEDDDYLATNKCMYLDICDAIEAAYKCQANNNEWPPARHAHDSKVPPTRFVSQANVKELIKAFVLEQTSSTTPPKKPGTCHNCGSLDHWKNECPKLKAKKNKSESWKTTLPKDGSPEKVEKNEKMFYWCNKCCHWTTTHGTSTHHGQPSGGHGNPKPEAPKASKTQGSLAIYTDPSAWTLDLSPEATHPM